MTKKFNQKIDQNNKYIQFDVHLNRYIYIYILTKFYVPFATH